MITGSKEFNENEKKERLTYYLFSVSNKDQTCRSMN
jgi:hypothetical protein